MFNFFEKIAEGIGFKLVDKFSEKVDKWINEVFKNTKENEDDSKNIASSENYAQVASSGDNTQVASSGYCAQVASSGDSAQVASSGDSAQVASSGDYAEEIEKAKIKLQEIKEFWLKYDYATDEGKKNLLVNANVIETLLQYIQELEQSNKYLDRENNRLEKIEFERDMANKMIDEILRYFAPNFDCPLDRENIDLDCENRCNSNNDNLEAECWKKYFERR